MPGTDVKNERLQDKLLQQTRLDMPVVGLESEFNVWLDEVEIDPKPFWKHPGAFIDRPLLPREKSSLQLPTGGAVYFDRGVIEVVTPVIELAPNCTARVVRNLWEQIGFVRDQLTKWGKTAGHTVRLKAYSTHYNISYEIPEWEQTKDRNEKTLALLLAYILPVPVMVVGGNRRSTGVGVRPRGARMEVTVDFTPDPGLMVATATLIVGIVREVMTWPSYDLAMLQTMRVPVIDGVVPGKHTTRKGWLTKDFHYLQSPYTCDINAPIWQTQLGQTRTLRQIAKDTAWLFRRAIRRYSDPFSFRLLFAILDGRAPSMLELVDRPSAYEDVGRLCKWGMVIHELKNYQAEMDLLQQRREAWPAAQTIDDYVVERQKTRQQHVSEMETVNAATPHEKALMPFDSAPPVAAPTPARRPARANGRSRARAGTRAGARPSTLTRRRNDTPGRLMPPRASQYLDRRGTSLLPPRETPQERRNASERRRRNFAIPFPDRRLSRSAYEQVFLKLVSGGRLRQGGDVYTPIGMKGWYHALFRRDTDGAEKLFSIDELLGKMNDWI
jgi:hypothetical protein